MNKLQVSSVELRDGQQSLIATRMRTEDMIPVLEKMDQIGYNSIEMWGGATFDSCIRYLAEDPWERVRIIKRFVTNTPLRMLLRGQNLVGYRQYSDDIVDRFVKLAANAGIDIFLVFDGLNDLRNCEAAIKAVKKYGKTAEGNICYTVSPVHSIETYVQLAIDFEKLGVSAIHVEDMAGLMKPTDAYELISAIKKAVAVPVHFQCHCTGGMADLSYWEAIRAGVDVVDANVSALSLGTAHPPIESLAIALESTDRPLDVDLKLLSEINSHFLAMREKYKAFESKFTGVDVSVLRHKIPGGMLSNMENQLLQMNAIDRIVEVLEEVHRVQEDLGYPPLATPFSQMCGAQATANVLTGSRYKMISKETRSYIEGKYGKSPGKINETLVETILKGADPIACRPADLLVSDYEALKAEIGSIARTEEDIMTYVMFPAIARSFLEEKYK